MFDDPDLNRLLDRLLTHPDGAVLCNYVRKELDRVIESFSARCAADRAQTKDTFQTKMAEVLAEADAMSVEMTARLKAKLAEVEALRAELRAAMSQTRDARK